jgi:hypothetical protein
MQMYQLDMVQPDQQLQQYNLVERGRYKLRKFESQPR